MKLSERLALLKAGYSKDEINAMIEDDAKEAKETPKDAPEDNGAGDMMKVMAALANEVKDLKTAMYKKNIAESEGNKGGQLTAEDILASLINPPEDKKGE
ncbi:MAG: hypothetical protein IKA94_06175 [Mogibacterium sp.]|nr:hypothetical protein [Mogibacterium sp.]MBR4091066.1 hypothetical protein [Mogibacterium sp.]